MSIVASTLGLTLDTIGTVIESCMAHGQSVGVRQVYTGMMDGTEWYQATFLGHIDPRSAVLRVREESKILASTPVNCVVDPEITIWIAGHHRELTHPSDGGSGGVAYGRRSAPGPSPDGSKGPSVVILLRSRLRWRGMSDRLQLSLWVA